MPRQELKIMTVNGDKFLLPPYKFAQYKIITECPETGKKSCSSVIASEGTIDIPEGGCVIEFYTENGEVAEQPIKLVLEDTERVAEKMRAHEEAQKKAAQAIADEKQAREVEKTEKEGGIGLPVQVGDNMIDQYTDDNPQCFDDDSAADKAFDEAAAYAEKTPQCCDDKDACTDEACDEMMTTSDEDEEDSDGDGDYTYPSED